MSVPHFPPELWARIFIHLDPATLSVLSEVNQTFNKLATDESLFRRHIIQLDHSHPAQQYRRLQALHYPPEIRTSSCAFMCTEMLCVVEDTIVMGDFVKKSLIWFGTSGLSVDIQENIDCIETILYMYLPRSTPEQRHVVLPDGHLGFFYTFHPTYFAVLCVKTGELMTFPVPDARLPLKEMLDGKHVFAAVSNAEWIAYHTDDNKIALVDWRIGELVKEVEQLCNGVKYLIGECSAIAGSSIVGLVFEKNKGSAKEVLARGFDNVEEKFQTYTGNTVHWVLRSSDTKTYVMIMTFDTDVFNGMRFSAYRQQREDETRWQGTLSMRAFPELQDNGHVVISRCGTMPKGSGLIFDGQSVLASKFSPQHAWVELVADGSAKKATIPVPVPGGLPVWVRRTVDGGLAVIRDTGEYNVVLVKLVREGQYYRHLRLQSWKIEGMIGIHVVADHYIVAQNCHGRLIVIQFARFCDGDRGVYACPGMVDDKIKN